MTFDDIPIVSIIFVSSVNIPFIKLYVLIHPLHQIVITLEGQRRPCIIVYHARHKVIHFRGLPTEG